MLSFHRLDFIKSGTARQQSPSRHDVLDAWSRAQGSSDPLFRNSFLNDDRNSHDMSDDVLRTRRTPIALSFQQPVLLNSRRGREYSTSNSYNVSDDESRAQGAPFLRSFFEPPLFPSARGRERSANR